jgi:hypothetical protein
LSRNMTLRLFWRSLTLPGAHIGVGGSIVRGAVALVHSSVTG